MSTPRKIYAATVYVEVPHDPSPQWEKSFLRHLKACLNHPPFNNQGFTITTPEALTDLSVAYDGGSRRRMRRSLQPLEREIIVRIIADIFGAARRAHREGKDPMLALDAVPIRMDGDELPLLQGIQVVLDPRGEYT